MNRRNFLKKGSFAGAAAVAISSCQAPEKKGNDHNGERAAGDSPGDFELNEITIAELQEKMGNGSFTSKQVTDLYLKRIDKIDKNGPALRAVIEVNPDAPAIAEAMDRERKAGKIRGPLHGIPVLIKDNIDTADKMQTTSGSLALQGHQPAADAFIVRKLREAGAVLLGKTNLSEWANFRSSRSSSGWSSRGGQTKNPCVLDRNPCGSSSGSAVAVAANLCTVAIGTETDGSIIAPAAYTGTVGIKPTVGLWSRSGIIPISVTQDTAGPMTRTVRDAAILLGALAGIDDADKVTMTSEGKTKKDYTANLRENGLQGKRIGIEKKYLEGHEGVVGLYRKAIELMKSKGATIIEVDLLKKTADLNDPEFTVLKYEFKDGLNRYLSASNAPVKSLKEVIAFNKANEQKAMPFFKQEILEESENKAGLESDEYKIALAKTLGCRGIIDDLMKAHQLHAIASTSIGPAHCTDLVNGDYWTGFYFCPPAAMAGYPHITVPMGTLQELPVGLSFISGAYEEEELLNIAYAYELASQHRTAPKFLKTVPV